MVIHQGFTRRFENEAATPPTVYSRQANKEALLTTVPFIRVILTVVVMVTHPAFRNAAQVVTAILALCACSRACGCTKLCQSLSL